MLRGNSMPGASRVVPHTHHTSSWVRRDSRSAAATTCELPTNRPFTGDEPKYALELDRFDEHAAIEIGDHALRRARHLLAVVRSLVLDIHLLRATTDREHVDPRAPVPIDFGGDSTRRRSTTRRGLTRLWGGHLDRLGRSGRGLPLNRWSR
jgi:hypothetical protein